MFFPYMDQVCCASFCYQAVFELDKFIYLCSYDTPESILHSQRV